MATKKKASAIKPARIAKIEGRNVYVLTVADVAAMLGVRPAEVRLLCDGGDLAAVNLGGRRGWAISRKSAEAFLAKNGAAA